MTVSNIWIYESYFEYPKFIYSSSYIKVYWSVDLISLQLDPISNIRSKWSEIWFNMDLFDTLPKVGNKSVFRFASPGGWTLFRKRALIRAWALLRRNSRYAFGVSTNKIGFSGFNMGRRESTILKHEVLQGPSTASSLHDFTYETRTIT